VLSLKPVSEDALMLYLGDSANPETAARVQTAVSCIEQLLGDVLVDLVPSYASVLIIYDPLATDHLSLSRRLREALEKTTVDAGASGKTVVLPVYYGAEVAPDLEDLAVRAALSRDKVIALHCAVEYHVYAIGFAPGFAYLGQVDERIAAPRRATPRMRVPQGAVAIADRQTAVYPAASPGGWNLIGRCPVPMFDSSAKTCMPVEVGDSVRFEAITREEFLSLGGDLEGEIV